MENLPERTEPGRAALQVTPMTLLQAAQAQGGSIETLKSLMELQFRWEEAEARKAYNEAIAGFKSENVQIFKDCSVSFPGRGGTTAYKHANLASIVSRVAPVLAKHGLSHGWETQQDGGMVQVTCKISHRLGHCEKVTLQASADTSGSKNSIQAIGSTVTYLQRYTLISALGLAAHDMDDDGGGGTEGERSQFKTMDDRSFEAVVGKWAALLRSGAKTVRDIENAAHGKGLRLTDAQLNTLKEKAA